MITPVSPPSSIPIRLSYSGFQVLNMFDSEMRAYIQGTHHVLPGYVVDQSKPFTVTLSSSIGVPWDIMHPDPDVVPWDVVLNTKGLLDRIVLKHTDNAEPAWASVGYKRYKPYLVHVDFVVTKKDAQLCHQKHRGPVL